MAANLEALFKNEFVQRKHLTAMKIRDADHDGKLSKADYKLVIKRYETLGASEAHLKILEQNYSDMWKVAGIADDTTELTYEQFTANASKNAANTTMDKNFMTHFDIIDGDGNGEISFKEWVQYYIACGIDIIHARASFDAMDANHDGVISKEEFIAYAKEFFFSVEDKLKSSILYGPLCD